MPIPTINLHASGPQFSRLIFGAWRLASWKLSTRELLALIHTSADLGISTIDHADLYGEYACEELFGAALREEPTLRSRLQLVTKCGIKIVSAKRPSHTLKHYDTSRAHILASAENSLKVLHTDYLDLLLIHRPDPFMDPDDTAAAFEALVQSGKVRHVGVSNFTPSQFDLLQSRLSIPLVTNQIEISVLKLSPFLDGSLDHCQRLRFAPMAWSPLGGGNLFGDSEQAQRARAALHEIGHALPIPASVDQVALAWLLAHPARIVPVLGTGKADRLRAASASAEIKLSREQWYKIWIACGGGVP